MKLEIKHLAPYLPYNLKCEVLNSGQEKEIGEMIAVYNDGSACFGNIVESEKGFEYIKPILRPISSLTIENMKEFSGSDFKRYSIEYLETILETYKKEIFTKSLSYRLMQKLFKNHIDVFGLIEEGLAIDINTLSVQNDG